MKDSETWHTAVHGMVKSQDKTERLNKNLSSSSE